MNNRLADLTEETESPFPSIPPDELPAILSGYTCSKDNVGCSSAKVYHFQKEETSLYLKIQKSDNEIRREYEILKWLDGKLPVPHVLYFCEKDGLTYLLTTEVPGHMSCVCPEDVLCSPYENTVKLLADGLLLLQSVDIINCPFMNILDLKLEKALYNIQNDLVDRIDFEENCSFDTPMDLYEYLINNKPPEDLCFTHGDYCLPNIFIENGIVTGFIDMGRGGVADKWQDIALCVRSLRYNLRHMEEEKYIDLLLHHLNLEPDWEKINYYILLDELF